MKPFISTLILLLSLLSSLHAQDTLRKINGRSYPVKVEEIKPFVVTYRVKPNGVVKTMSKSEIAAIIHPDGTRDSFLVMKGRSIDTAKSGLNRATLYEWGRTDAKSHYGGSSGANTGTFLVAFLGGGAIGLIPAIACSTTPPNPRHTLMPNGILADNQYYREGYLKKAKSIKNGKVWASWGWGTAAAIASYLILTHH